MPIIRWKPFKDFNDFFEDFGHSHCNGGDLAVDVFEQNSDILVEMNIPGINPDKIDIEVENMRLHVSGSREEKSETKDKQYYHKEVRRGSFERVIQLPCPVDQTQTRADFKDGVLTITLPKKEHSGSSKIKVEKR